MLADEASSIHARATFAAKHLWVTRYDPAERYPAGDFVNQNPGGAGLPDLGAGRPGRSTARTSSCGTPSAPPTSRGRRTGR